jgi:hypothetical protein
MMEVLTRFQGYDRVIDMGKREEAKFRVNTRERLRIEQGNRCRYCDCEITRETASLDHVIPVDALEEEEDHNPNNYVTTCKTCNINKGNYIVFSNIDDRIVYPIIDVPYFFRWDYIQTNNHKK